MKIEGLSTGASAGGVGLSWKFAQLRLPAALIVCAFAISFGRAAQQVEIHNLSLRFTTSTSMDGSGRTRLDLTSGSRNTPANGELALAQGTNSFTHSGFMFLAEPSLARTNYYSISLNIPTDDRDGNGMLDVLEQQVVTSVHTVGTYTGDDLVSRAILATWNKEAGSHTGNCTVELPDLGLTFTAVFENIHYSGTFSPRKTGSNLVGPMHAYRNGVEKSTLSGSLNLQILNPELLGWGMGEWQTESGEVISYEGSDLDRAAFEYAGYYVTIATMEYQTWLLVLPNIPDANGNRIPDLIEDGVRLMLSMNGNIPTLKVTGGAGGTFDLETRSSLSATSAWSKVGTYTFATDSESIPLTVPDTGSTFWRLSQ